MFDCFRFVWLKVYVCFSLLLFIMFIDFGMEEESQDLFVQTPGAAQVSIVYCEALKPVESGQCFV